MMEYIEVLVAPDNPDLDIVFVHGLNPKGQENHARKTWTHSGDASPTEIFWPQTLLPESVPTARILLFAYNSSILANASNAPVNGHANTLLNRLYNKRREETEKHRSIIFIAHSLGGLLVKQALVEAKLNPLYTCIKTSTFGLVFFATPHSGGNGASVADSAAKLCSALTGQAKNSLLETLKTASLLNEISKDHFRPQIGDYAVLTFIETHKMDVRFRRRRFMPKITSMYIVDTASAKLGAPQEIALGLDRNHSEICKFLGKDDRAYQGVEPNLRAMAESSRGHSVQCDHSTVTPQQLFTHAIPHVNSVPGAPPSFIGLPNRRHHVNLVRRCDPFVGREALTRDICNTWIEWNSSLPRRISLSGLGSVGKTQLSRSVIDQLGPRQIILWLRASSAKTLQEDLLTAALDLKTELLLSESRSLNLSQQVTGEARGILYSSGTGLHYLLDLLKVWLRTARAEQSKILVVLDDLDGLEPSELSELSDLISSEHIEVIYSTRDPMIADQTSYMHAANFNVPPLESRDAQELFQQLRNPHPTFAHLRYRSVLASGLSEPEMISKLLTSVGHIPAAIVNATHYFKDNFASMDPYALSAFLAKLEDSEAARGGLLQFRRRTFIYPHTMQASFEISLNRLKRGLISEKPDMYTCSLYLLRLLTIMDVNQFARTELESLCTLLGKFVGSEKAKNKILDQLSSDTSVTYRCITELVHVSLLSDPEDRGVLLLNNLTKACVWLTMTDEKSETALSEPVLGQVAKFLAQSWTPCSSTYV